MSVYATLDVQADDFIFGRIDHIDFHAEFERAVPLGEAVPRYLWILNPPPETLDRLVASEPSIDRIDIHERTDDRILGRVDWNDNRPTFFSALVASDAICIRSIGTVDVWEFVLRFPTRDLMAHCYRSCLDRGIGVSVKRLHESDPSHCLAQPSVLTPPQREALTTALEAGYFDVPREVTLQELAEHIGVSDTAISQRLRRGVKNLLMDSLVDRRY